MSSREVDVQFGEVPVIQTVDNLISAAGMLVLSHYACELRLNEECLSMHGDRVDEPGMTIQALHWALAYQFPAKSWHLDDPIPLEGSHEDDDGLHVDEMIPGIVSIGCHVTDHNNAVESVFASPTSRFVKSKDEPRLTKLLDSRKTDSSLVKPKSFRKTSFSSGGIVAFTYTYPGARPQLHRFRTLSKYRKSKVWIFEGY